MSESEFLKLLHTLIDKGYTAGESVWSFSISYVTYEYTSGYDLMYTNEDAPKDVPRLFALHEIEWKS